MYNWAKNHRIRASDKKASTWKIKENELKNYYKILGVQWGYTTNTKNQQSYSVLAKVTLKIQGRGVEEIYLQLQVKMYKITRNKKF